MHLNIKNKMIVNKDTKEPSSFKLALSLKTISNLITPNAILDFFLIVQMKSFPVINKFT